MCKQVSKYSFSDSLVSFVNYSKIDLQSQLALGLWFSVLISYPVH